MDFVRFIEQKSLKEFVLRSTKKVHHIYWGIEKSEYYKYIKIKSICFVGKHLNFIYLNLLINNGKYKKYLINRFYHGI